MRRVIEAALLLLLVAAATAFVPFSRPATVEGQVGVQFPTGKGALPRLSAPGRPVPAHAPKVIDPANRYALLIGVGKFQGRTQPNPGSAGDAIDVRELLLRNGWPDDHVRILTDGAATATAIRSGLQWLVDRCDATSACVFHYSGHVKQNRAADGDSEVLDENLWGHDNKFIPDGEVARYLSRLPSAWINISGCEAAGFNDGVSSPNRLFTASSAESEKSYENPEWKNSVWTGLLVDQGILQRGADADRDGLVTRDEAFGFAAGPSAQITRLQSKGPQHPYWAGGETGSWLLPPQGVDDASASSAPRGFHGPCAFGLSCHRW